MSGPELITLGCRLNIVESEAIRAFAADQDDLIVVNSCAVTAEAVRTTRQAIRRAHRRRPDARILVTGCAAETDAGALAAMAEVSAVVPNRLKTQASAFMSKPVAGSASPRTPAFADHARGFVAVQNGCDHACTFCITTHARGPSRSEPIASVVAEIAALADRGFREVVLTGVDLTSYTPSLGELVERILRDVPALPRLRLSSLDAIEIDDRLFALIAGEPRLMPHLHLSLQSGDDLILKRMLRRHTRAQAIDLVQRLKALRPDLTIGADLIAGFPTETEAMAANSLALLDECDILFAHIFPYSPREGTPAARMPQVAPAIAKARAARLREAAALRKHRWLDSLRGQTLNVLIEKDGRSGHAENFAKVRMPDGGAFAGRIVALRITARNGDTLLGIPA